MVEIKEENPASTNPTAMKDGYEYNTEPFVAATAVNSVQEKTTGPPGSSDQFRVKMEVGNDSYSDQVPIVRPIPIYPLINREVYQNLIYQQMPILQLISPVIEASVKEEGENENPMPRLQPFSVKEEPPSDFAAVPTIKEEFPQLESEVVVPPTTDSVDPIPRLEPVSVKEELQSDFSPIPTIKEEFPQPESEDVLPPTSDWEGEFVRGRIHPGLIFKFIAASETGEGLLKCYSFDFETFNKYSTRYMCSECKSLKVRTSITALGNKFLNDPLTLNHVCKPEFYEVEKMRREKIIDLQTVRERVAAVQNSDGQNGTDSQQQLPNNSLKLLRLYDKFAPRVKHPALYFRSNCEKDLCWLFVGKSKKKNGYFECNGCFMKGCITKIRVEDGKFCGDPSELHHVCDPLLWAQEKLIKRPKFMGLENCFRFTDDTAEVLQEKLYDAVAFTPSTKTIPVLYFRSLCEKDICWPFIKKSVGKKDCYYCASCWSERVCTKIMVKDNKFCSDPSNLQHVCEPLSWPQVEAQFNENVDNQKKATKSKRAKRTSKDRKEGEGIEKTSEEGTAKAEECVVPEKRIKVEIESQ